MCHSSGEEEQVEAVPDLTALLFRVVDLQTGAMSSNDSLEHERK